MVNSHSSSDGHCAVEFLMRHGMVMLTNVTLDDLSRLRDRISVSRNERPDQYLMTCAIDVIDNPTVKHFVAFFEGEVASTQRTENMVTWTSCSGAMSYFTYTESNADTASGGLFDRLAQLPLRTIDELRVMVSVD